MTVCQVWLQFIDTSEHIHFLFFSLSFSTFFSFWFHAVDYANLCQLLSTSHRFTLESMQSFWLLWIHCSTKAMKCIIITQYSRNISNAVSQSFPRWTGTVIVIVLVLWLGSWVVSVLDSGAEGPGFKSQSRCCRVTVLGKLFTPIVPLFTKQQNW